MIATIASGTTGTLEEKLIVLRDAYRTNAFRAHRQYSENWPGDTPYNGAEEEGYAERLRAEEKSFTIAAEDIEHVLHQSGCEILPWTPPRSGSTTSETCCPSPGTTPMIGSSRRASTAGSPTEPPI